jgi:hypothetical protein
LMMLRSASSCLIAICKRIMISRSVCRARRSSAESCLGVVRR